jgi:hypothetical protein
MDLLRQYDRFSFSPAYTAAQPQDGRLILDSLADDPCRLRYVCASWSAMCLGDTFFVDRLWNHDLLSRLAQQFERANACQCNQWPGVNNKNHAEGCGGWAAKVFKSSCSVSAE